jgi:hypothetical protein
LLVFEFWHKQFIEGLVPVQTVEESPTDVFAGRVA